MTGVPVQVDLPVRTLDEGRRLLRAVQASGAVRRPVSLRVRDDDTVTMATLWPFLAAVLRLRLVEQDGSVRLVGTPRERYGRLLLFTGLSVGLLLPLRGTVWMVAGGALVTFVGRPRLRRAGLQEAPRRADWVRIRRVDADAYVAVLAGAVRQVTGAPAGAVRPVREQARTGADAPGVGKARRG